MGEKLEDLIKQVNKQYKTTLISEGMPDENIDRIPFSSPRLNYMMYGGIPQGRLVEFFGSEGGGKTTSALDIVKNAQQMFPEKRVLYIDCERTLDTEWATLLGVNIDELILFRPETETAEQIFEVALKFMDSGEISLCVLDSLGVMVSAQAYEKTMEERTYGGISQALTLFSRKAVPICARNHCTLIGINQMRDDMGSMYGGETTTGGKAWRHNCSVRLQFRKGEYIDEKNNGLTRGCENPAGNLVQCSIIKSKVCRSDRRTGFYTLKYLEGIDYISDTIDVAQKLDMVIQGGAWYTLLDTETGEVIEKFQGRDKLKTYLKENPDRFEDLKEKISKKIF